MPNRIQLLNIASNATESFRSLVSGTESALANFGWINTNASGTINFNTVNPPTATNQSRGYSVWRLNDEFQNIAPVFIKIEYGTGSMNTVANPAIWMTVGKVHDGSGSLYQTGKRWQVWGGNYISNPITPVLSSGGPGWGWVCYSPGVGVGNTFMFNVERGRDRNGNINPDIVAYYGISAAANIGDFSYLGRMATGTLPPAKYELSSGIQFPIYLPDDSSGVNITNGLSISNAPVAMFAMNGEKNGAPLTNVLFIKRYMTDSTSDLLSLNPYNIPYQYINAGSGIWLNQILSLNETSMILRWE